MAIEADLVGFRRDIHRHPETSGNEERTAGLVAARLRSLGFEVQGGVGGPGVVGVLRGAAAGPMVAFRADLDAVPSTAPDPVEFRSVIPGVRHICGHDLHTTVGIALAEGFAAARGRLAGSVMLVFQPAEERATGARAMLADGLFGRDKPVAIFAVHTAPLPVGQLSTAPGEMMANQSRLRVTVTGAGDLDGAADSVRRLIQATGTVPLARQLEPAPAGFSMIRVGPPVPAPNGNGRVVTAVVVTASQAARDRVRALVEAGVARLGAPNVTGRVEFEEKVIAGIDNDAALVSRATAAIREVLGPDAVVPSQAVPPAFSEDFGSFQALVPGVLFFLGVSNPAKGTVGMPHTPDYVADEGAILVAAKAMTAAMLDVLSRR
jgi:metal-dependent amidase/aminoacylase/carboxypeptidase family protein